MLVGHFKTTSDAENYAKRLRKRRRRLRSFGIKVSPFRTVIRQVRKKR